MISGGKRYLDKFMLKNRKREKRIGDGVVLYILMSIYNRILF